MIPLVLEMIGCATEAEMNANVDATLARGYESIVPILETRSGAVSLCGSGPSLERTLGDLRGDVLAINGAIGYLLQRGVVPTWAMLWDAAQVVSEFAVPHPDITYLVASRCHPDVFERLRGCKVIVWFAGGDHNIVEYCQAHEIDDPLVMGGSAGITRAMFLAHALGYRYLHLHGADSSYSDDGRTHVEKSLVPEQDIVLWIGNDPGTPFRTTLAWCAQVNEFRDIYTLFRHPDMDCKITVHGDGMLPHMARLMRAKEAAGELWQKLDVQLDSEPLHSEAIPA